MTGLHMVEYHNRPDLQPALLEHLRACAWRAGPYLARCLAEGTGLEPGDRVFFLLDGQRPVSYLTLARQDCIEDDSLSPWIGFVHTDPKHRGRRYSGLLIAHALEAARQAGHGRVWLATDHVGLYEKYGFGYVENRVDIHGEDSRIYAYGLAPGREVAP